MFTVWSASLFLGDLGLEGRQLRLVVLRGDRLLGGLLEVGGRRHVAVVDRHRRGDGRRGRRRRDCGGIGGRVRGGGRVLVFRLGVGRRGLVTRGEREKTDGGEDDVLHFAPPLVS